MPNDLIDLGSFSYKPAYIGWNEARSTAFASAEKICEPLGSRCILQLFSDITANPNF